MPSDFPLQSLLDLAQIRLDEATRRLGELISSEKQASERLELLAQYREEYQKRFLAAAQNGLGREAWANYQAFFGRLDEAIAQARAAVEASQQRTRDGQKAWLEQRGRLKAFDTLAQRHQERLLRIAARREQKISDEHAARVHERQDGEG